MEMFQTFVSECDSSYSVEQLLFFQLPLFSAFTCYLFSNMDRDRLKPLREALELYREPPRTVRLHALVGIICIRKN
jgi:hypothetical protein